MNAAGLEDKTFIKVNLKCLEPTRTWCSASAAAAEACSGTSSGLTASVCALKLHVMKHINAL